jgi:hypothetical protein
MASVVVDNIVAAATVDEKPSTSVSEHNLRRALTVYLRLRDYTPTYRKSALSCGTFEILASVPLASGESRRRKNDRAICTFDNELDGGLLRSSPQANAAMIAA